MPLLRSRRLETMLGAPVEELSARDIEMLARNRVSEAFDLDFKGTLYGNSDRERRDLWRRWAYQRELGGASAGPDSVEALFAKALADLLGRRPPHFMARRAQRLRKRQHRLPVATPGRGRKQDAHEENLTGYDDREGRAVGDRTEAQT